MPQYFGKLPTTNQPWNHIGSVQAVNWSDSTVNFDCGNSRLQVTILSPNLIRVRFSPTGEFTPRRSWAVTVDDSEWTQLPFEVQDNETAVEITTGKIRLCVEKQNSRLVCFDKDNHPFAEDVDLGIGWRQGAVAGWKKIYADEHFYGFGERTGFLDKLSQVKTNWTVDALDYDALTDEMYQAIPFFMALRPELSYGIFFNTTFWSQFDIGAAQPGVWKMETRGTELDYYIIYGPEPADILRIYTQLTGKMPLPPKWALGYHQCRWSYESEDVVRELAQEFRQRRIPCDVIHLDIDYMRGYRVFTWSPQRFPEPGKLIGDLAQAGFKTVTIIDPGVKYEPEANYHVFDTGLANDYFVRKADGALFHGYVWPEKAVFPDFLRSDVRQWWGDLHKSLTDIGVAGIWNDMNEPAIDNRPFGDGGEKIWFPLDAPQGDEEKQGSREQGAGGNLSASSTTHLEVHNLYGLMMAKACAEGLKRYRQTERSFVLTRSGYAGVQRWSAVWMGDNQSLWEHLEMSLPMLCNMGLSGVAFVGCDIGGFAGNATAELFARWMQVGMLYPLMRGHSAMSTARHEPWVFGDRTENICREYINLRYQLLPYIYNLFWEAAQTGAPILRPLFYHYPRDRQTYTIYDQVFLGASLMAAPIYRPGVEYRAVYLPAGTWYDWWTGEQYTGPTHILSHAPLEKMPLYVRGGAIIPMQPVQQYVGESPQNSLRWRIWPGDNQYLFFEDDGISNSGQNQNYSLREIRVYTQENQIVVDIVRRVGEWIPPEREVIVEVVGIGEQRFTDDGSAYIFRF
ncbi:glycoside hydrolase family 31 protein [Calothrix sp. FACHB-1219]|uniref:glycoside hydrolase family 31 protein n=1 Tax=unclassified Calothrix TaxID=2619626 RepID=UPI0016878139|nr:MULTISPECIES: glycoside hydrolase family 31 protein [unclassified Calothrix]MBD2202053.1 glycoside hydrolase family 31 protein [Calothrix sp. FACHB-168]MBD2217088.1 glycoside hydrolase family 31 protein [Calothrix sp. FACHB-1219]